MVGTHPSLDFVNTKQQQGSPEDNTSIPKLKLLLTTNAK